MAQAERRVDDAVRQDHARRQPTNEWQNRKHAVDVAGRRKQDNERQTRRLATELLVLATLPVVIGELPYQCAPSPFRYIAQLSDDARPTRQELFVGWLENA